jgi:hypothetical protein
MRKKNFGVVTLPPFTRHEFRVDVDQLLDPIIRNPHPTDLVLDTSVFARDRIPLVTSILARFRPILLSPVLMELQDLKAKPELMDLRDLVFPADRLNERFRGDDQNVLSSYPRFSLKYASLLQWRRKMIDIEARRIERETGNKPTGKARDRMIRELVRQGLATDTIRIANKDYRVDRPTDELLAVFAVISPVISGRDCFLLTADKDVYEQTLRMIDLLFNDYGAYLIANDFRMNEAQYTHRHPHVSPLFIGDAEAIGRDPHPDYLLPPPRLMMTCATHVIDVVRLKCCTFLSARNMHPAISFQEHDPLGRKGDPGMNRSILFTLPDGADTSIRCKRKHHFVLGNPQLLKLTGDFVGPVPYFELLRATLNIGEDQTRPRRILTPFSDHQQLLLSRVSNRRKH